MLVDFGHLRQTFDKCRPNLANLHNTLAKFRPTLATLGQVLIGRCRAKLGKVWDNFGRTLPHLARGATRLKPMYLDQVWGQFGPGSTRFGQQSVCRKPVTPHVRPRVSHRRGGGSARAARRCMRSLFGARSSCPIGSGVAASEATRPPYGSQCVDALLFVFCKAKMQETRCNESVKHPEPPKVWIFLAAHFPHP